MWIEMSSRKTMLVVLVNTCPGTFYSLYNNNATTLTCQAISKVILTDTKDYRLKYVQKWINNRICMFCVAVVDILEHMSKLDILKRCLWKLKKKNDWQHWMVVKKYIKAHQNASCSLTNKNHNQRTISFSKQLDI